MPVAIYPGTFDPVTLGHVDIARRASHVFTKVIAVVSKHPDKNCFFSVDERKDMLAVALRDIENVEVIEYKGLTADCVKDYKASVIIRGLRVLTDFDYEFQMAFANRNLNKKAETVFFMPGKEYAYLSSSMVRQISRLNGDISQLVPSNVIDKMNEKRNGL